MGSTPSPARSLRCRRGRSRFAGATSKSERSSCTFRARDFDSRAREPRRHAAGGTRMTTADRSAVRAAVVIPAYEAASTIALVVADARRHLDTELVVDDGSQDGTAQRATPAGAAFLSHGRKARNIAPLLTGMRTPA